MSEAQVVATVYFEPGASVVAVESILKKVKQQLEKTIKSGCYIESIVVEEQVCSTDGASR